MASSLFVSTSSTTSTTKASAAKTFSILLFVAVLVLLVTMLLTSLVSTITTVAAFNTNNNFKNNAFAPVVGVRNNNRIINDDINNKLNIYNNNNDNNLSSFSSSSSTLLRFQKAPAVAEEVKKSKEKETKNENETENDGVMTDEDEEVLFGHDALEERHPDFRSFKKTKTKTNGSTNGAVGVDSIMNDLDYSKTDPLINELKTIRENKLESCPQLWTEVSKVHPNGIALVDDHLCDKVKIKLTFREMNDVVNLSASIFKNKFGLKKSEHVTILAENSARWLQIDHGIQRAGGVSAVRGADAPLDELKYIYEHSDSAKIVVLQGPKLLQKLLNDDNEESTSCLGLSNDSHGNVKHVVLMNREKKTKDDLNMITSDCGNEINIYFWDDLLEQEKMKTNGDAANAFDELPKVTKNDVATIVYTSGTTGRPKGVMLTHGNLLHQTSHRLGPTKPYEQTEPLPNETMVSLLPVWHITERSFEIWMLVRGCKVVYSGIRWFKNDMALHKPEWLVLVPRVLEKIASGVQDKFAKGSAPVKILSKLFTSTGKIRAKNSKIAKGLTTLLDGNGPLERLASKAIVAGVAPLNFVGDKIVWKKVQDGFGGNLKTIISGGSALSGSLESFYETAGFNIVVGYGLTECSPLLSYRRSDENLVVAGCCGKPCLDTEIRVVDPDSKSTYNTDRKSLPHGEVGVVIGRGPQIMKGYYKNIEATNAAIDQYGWFDTGDLGRINPSTGDLILTGRVKDTIVLTNGENIEPTPIEDAILGSSGTLIDQVMITGGEEGKKLIAIVVLNPIELMNGGYVSERDGKRYQKSNEILNDPKCTQIDCDTNTDLLRVATEELRSNNPQNLKQTLVTAIKSSTSSSSSSKKKKQFRPWEVVNTVHFTLEPFAMSNGQLTQSYKVKRDAVYERYKDELPS